MQPTRTENYFPYSSPISLLEELFFQFEWHFDRISESEIAAEVEGRWCTYRLFAMWRQDIECFMLSALIDIKVPLDKDESGRNLALCLNRKI